MKKKIEEKYHELFGFIPEGIQNRLDLSERVQRLESIRVIEDMRDQLIYKTSIEKKTQQLIHFSMLIALGEERPAKIHAIAALRAGTSEEELFSVCETAAIVGGMPMFQRAINIVNESLANKSK